MNIKVIYLCGLIYIMAFLITLFVVPLTIKLAHKIKAIDIPNDDRRVHKKPIPRIGGIAIVIGVTITILFASSAGIFQVNMVDKVQGTVFLSWNIRWMAQDIINPIVGVTLGGLMIFTLGFVDDMIDMKPKIKLLGQIVVASFVYAIGVRIDFMSNFFGVGVTNLSEIACYIATVIWIVAITNTINLIDGLDGLATGVVAIAALCIAYVGYIFGFYIGAFPMLAIAGGALGFLPYNFYPAKTFMGDCGSQYLGFMLACFSILGTVKSTTFVAVLIPGLALLLPILDTVLAIFRRAISGKSIMEADRGHLHHRLLRSGMGQRRTVLCLYGVCGIMGTASVLLSRELYVETIGLLSVALMYVYVVLTNPQKTVPELKEKEKNEIGK